MRLRLFLPLLILLGTLTLLSFAQETSNVVSTVSIPGKSEEKDTPRPIKEFMPDAKKYEGLFNLYQKKDRLLAEITSSNLNTDYLICMAVAKGSGDSPVGGYTLNFGDDWLWTFRKVNDRIQVVRRNIRFKADPGTTEATAVDVAYSDSILYSLPILARGENGGDVIDLSSIFMSDLPELGSWIGGYFASDRSNWGTIKTFPNNVEIRVDATYATGSRFYSYYYYYPNFAAPDSKSTGVTIHYSISKLPSSGYTPRLADNRLGYFTTVHKNFSKNQDDEHFVRYINRWNLQKADPSLEKSPPKKPIVFYIEKTVPIKYRNAVREGILEWNKAFEKCGIIGAIEVRQQMESDTWDAEDINYNTFRWITADAFFAMGPSHVNPLTGEILDADVIMDAGFVDAWKRRFDIYLAEELPVLPNTISREEQIKHFLGLIAREEAEKVKERNREFGDQSVRGVANEPLNRADRGYANFMSSQIAFASIMLGLSEEDPDAPPKPEEPKPEEPKPEEPKPEEPKPEEPKPEEPKPEEPKPAEPQPETPQTEEPKTEDAPKTEEVKSEEAKTEEGKTEEKKEEKGEEKKPNLEEIKKKNKEAFEKLLLAAIKDIATHEVGHTLGLRHNFKAGSWLTLEEINDPNRSKEYGFSGSVMDYLPFNIMPKGKPQGDIVMSTLGPYDYLVIEYGYKPLSGSTEGDAGELRKIAARQAEKGNHYATDEDLMMGDDPLTTTGMLGSNAIDMAKARGELYAQLLPQLTNRAIKESGSYKDVAMYFSAILFNKVIAYRQVSCNIGGLYSNRDHRGDPGNRPPIQVVDAALQRESLKYLCDEVFGVDSFKVPAELYNMFTDEKWYFWDTMWGGYQIELRDMLLYAQLAVLRNMIYPWTLSRLDDMELRVKEGEDVFTVSELLETLTSAIFKELDLVKDGEFSSRKPAISLIRRNLQDFYFGILAMYTSGQGTMYMRLPESCQSNARVQLLTLFTRIQAILNVDGSKLDPASRAHLLNLNDRIQKVLNAQLNVRNP
ncbi:MAG: zinc-dependent metalloprotease [Thermoguttaceae bacterium]